MTEQYNVVITLLVYTFIIWIPLYLVKIVATSCVHHCFKKERKENLKQRLFKQYGIKPLNPYINRLSRRLNRPISPSRRPVSNDIHTHSF